MITVLAILCLGIALGIYLRGKEKLQKLNDKLTNWAIYLLLFLLGISVGTNNDILNNLDTIGLNAAIITLGAVAGSVLLAYVVYKLFFKASGNER